MVKASLISAIAVALGATAAPDVADKQRAEKAPLEAKTTHEQRLADASPESPRVAVNDFLEYVRTGKDVVAATYLEIMPKSKQAQKPSELARQLAAVLQSQQAFEVDNLSPDWNGDTEDGLPELQEDIAHISVDQKTAPTPVRMIYHAETEPHWRFDANTVAQIPTWYQRTPNAWVTQHLPKWLTRTGPAGVQFWQWAGLLLTAVVAWAIGFGVGRAVHSVAMRIVKRTHTEWDDVVVKQLQGPIALACSLGVAAAMVPLLDMPESADTFLFRAIKGGFLGVFFWVCVRAVDLFKDLIVRNAMATAQPASRSLVSLGSRFVKAILFVILVIAVLSQLGFPVASLLAGLGIGGLAVALAGQKTLENLIGTFAIGFDQPFREGDFVKVRDFQGTVETIGLRSTRFRTPDRTIITLPNGKLADEAIETYAARDRFRLFFTLPVRYGASADQLRMALSRLTTELKEQPKVDAGSISVKLTSLNEWSMAFEVLAMLNTTDTNEFNQIREAALLKMVHTLDELEVKIQPTLATAAAAEAAKNGSAPPLPKRAS